MCMNLSMPKAIIHALDTAIPLTRILDEKLDDLCSDRSLQEIFYV